MEQSVFFVGSPEEIAHHAAPLREIDYRIVAPGQVADLTRPGDLAVFFSEHFDRFRAACSELNDKQVATLYMIDGILEWRNAWENRKDEPACPWTMRPVLSHKVACIGPSQARVLSSWGNQDKVEIVGIPRLDGFVRQPEKRDTAAFHLLIMTAKWPGFTPDQLENTRRALRDLKNWITVHPVIQQRDLRVTWRLTRGLDEEIGVPNQLDDLTGNELAQVLQGVDAVITTPSTAMIEGMLAGLPVATLDYNGCPKYVPAAWEISSPVDIDRVITELAVPPPAKMHFQEAILNDALADRNATQRLENLIVGMLDVAARSVKAGKPLKFPENLAKYDPTAPFPFFDHARIFPNRVEFQLKDSRQLQSELGHARREITHLQGQIAQLEKELSQAHEIFEQIHRHPIAGPVVRVRQRILDWLARFSRKKTKTISGKVENGTKPTT